MFNHSAELDKIVPALVAFQRAVAGIETAETNEDYGSRYASLFSIRRSIREALSEYGLFVSQPPATGLGLRVHVETIIFHASGQYIATEGSLPIDTRANVHDVTSAFTYLSRYGLTGALGLPGLKTDDDDGNRLKSPGKAEPCPIADEPPASQQAPAASGFVPVSDNDNGPTYAEAWNGDPELGPYLKDEREEWLEIFVRKLEWARTFVPHGKNKGMLLGQLDDDSISAYERVLKERPSSPLNTEAFASAIESWRIWKTANLKKPKVEKTSIAQSASAPEREAERPPTPAATTPAALTAAPENMGEVASRQNELKNRKDLPKRPKALPGEASTKPAEAAKPVESVKVAPIAEKPQGGPPTGQDAPSERRIKPTVEDWRDYPSPIGKTRKGVLLGEMPVDELRSIKKEYLDKRQWDKPDTLKPFDHELKRHVESGILALEGAQPDPAINLPAGPVRDLYRELISPEICIDPNEFLDKMKHLGKIPATILHFEHLRAEEASVFLSDMDATIRTFEQDLFT